MTRGGAGAGWRRRDRAAVALACAPLAVLWAVTLAPVRPAGARGTSGRVAGLGATHGSTASATVPSSRGQDAARARALQQLHAHEEQLRAGTDFRRPVAGDKVTGDDPFLVRSLPGGGDRLVGVLRGAAQLVLLDGDLRTIARAPAPRAPTGLVVDDSGVVFVSGELSSEIARYRVAGDAIVPDGRVDLGAGRALRDLATGPGGVLYAVDARGGRLITLRAPGSAASGAAWPAGRDEIPIGHGAIRALRVGPLLLVDCLLDHAVLVFRVDGDGRPRAGEVARIQHDGPIWSFDAAVIPSHGAADDSGAELILVVAGVEDHPLDRTIGSFGYIDSFLTVYRAPLAGASGPLRLERLSTTNLSEGGVVTPKVVSLEITGASDSAGAGGQAWVSGYGSESLASVVWRRFTDAPAIEVSPLAPGTTSLARRRDGALVFADPLLDAWVVRAPGAGAALTVVGAGAGDRGGADSPLPARAPAVRLGEALFFTTLMAPWNRAEGATSRFTCETCHFEGGVDGRTHHTGRGDVRATTKSLRGLLANRPYFSRALDPDMATMVNNEFRVAGASSGRDPWFDLSVGDHPWLGLLGVEGAQVRAPALRAALMSFLASFTPLPNPVAATASAFTAQQRDGAAVFRERCEGCHQARLCSDDPATRVSFADWERLILGDANPLVWGTPEYQKTGVVPYVHERGARVPALRRVSAKFPYFTNGSARSLDDVIAGARFAPAGAGSDGVSARFAHIAPPGEGTPAGGELDPAQAAALAAFLGLL